MIGRGARRAAMGAVFCSGVLLFAVLGYAYLLFMSASVDGATSFAALAIAMPVPTFVAFVAAIRIAMGRRVSRLTCGLVSAAHFVILLLAVLILVAAPSRGAFSAVDVLAIGVPVLAATGVFVIFGMLSLWRA